MTNYEVAVTAVSERADLFVESMTSLLANVDVQPSRLIVHEDVRPGSEPNTIWKWLERCGIPFEHQITNPASGLGPSMLRCFQQAKTPIVLYTQEDWLVLRPIPVARCLEIMEKHGLHHVRFNKRKTMKAKHEDTPHPWHKVEVEFSDGAGVPQKFCISDHWYTQTSLWRVDQVMKGLAVNAEAHPQANAFVPRFNHWMNLKHVGDSGRVQDQMTRHAKLKTYIWGPIAEPRFIQHLGSARTTGPVNHLARGPR